MFDREEVLGRDATSVFPTETKAQAVDVDAVKAALGSNTRFITESEVRSFSFTQCSPCVNIFDLEDSKSLKTNGLVWRS